MNRGIFAQGTTVMMDGEETATGYSMGGPIARTDNETQARAIALRCDLFPAMLALLVRYCQETPLGHQPHMIAGEADALIAKATAR